MKFSLEIQIQRSHDLVWKAFDNPQNTPKWQPTLIKYETISGTPGQSGAVSKLTYSEGGREFVLTEKITRRSEPDQIDGLFENDFAENLVKNSFIPISEKETLWKLETEFKFKTTVMKIIGPLMKRKYILRTEKEMERFKALAEGI